MLDKENKIVIYVGKEITEESSMDVIDIINVLEEQQAIDALEM